MPSSSMLCWPTTTPRTCLQPGGIQRKALGGAPVSVETRESAGTIHCHSWQKPSREKRKQKKRRYSLCMLKAVFIKACGFRSAVCRLPEKYLSGKGADLDRAGSCIPDQFSIDPQV